LPPPPPCSLFPLFCEPDLTACLSVLPLLFSFRSCLKLYPRPGFLFLKCGGGRMGLTPTVLPYSLDEHSSFPFRCTSPFALVWQNSATVVLFLSFPDFCSICPRGPCHPPINSPLPLPLPSPPHAAQKETGTDLIVRLCGLSRLDMAPTDQRFPHTFVQVFF